MDTNRQTIWPPPPTMSDPLAAHDAFLTALVCAPITKQPVSRLRLAMALRRASGLSLRQCSAFVHDYCDRKDIFLWERGFGTWLPMLPLLTQLVLVLDLLYRQAHLSRGLAAAHTYQVRHLILIRHSRLDQVCIDLIIANAVATVFVAVMTSRRVRREAEEARRRVGGGLGGA